LKDAVCATCKSRNIKMKGLELNINKRSNFDNFETLFIHVF